jgi:signal transduction histidine kinase
LLIESVVHVLEILEALTTREQRAVTTAVDAGTVVLADDMRLRQILLNLVGNALKYSPAGTGIEISSELQDEQLAVVRVCDHGAGVPPEDQPRLFERFMRLERDMNSPVRGVGLGLYICKQLVEAMGGHIWVESSGIPGEGSCFAFTLRRAIVEQNIVATVV